GAFTESDGSLTANGVVHVIFGSSTGLTYVGNLQLAQDTGSTVEGTPQSFDRFGQALTSGNWNGDGYDDLAVGSPLDVDGGATEAGVVNVFYGTPYGPSTWGDQLYDQDTSGIDDTSEAYDQFGETLR